MTITETAPATTDEAVDKGKVEGVASIAWLLGVAAAASTDSILHALTHIRLVSDGQTVWAQGTDRYVLASASLPAGKDGGRFDVLIPAKWALATAKACAKRVKVDDAQLVIDSHGITFSLGDTLTATKDGGDTCTFPSVGSVITGDGDDTANFCINPQFMTKLFAVRAACARGQKANHQLPRWSVRRRTAATPMLYGTVEDGAKSLALVLMGVTTPDGAGASEVVMASHREAPRPTLR